MYRLFGPILRLVQRIADLARTIYASFPMGNAEICEKID